VLPPLTIENLKECAAKWQRALRLEDWDVTFQIVRHNEIDGIGSTTISAYYRAAKVSLLSELDLEQRANDSAMPKEQSMNWELTLVHELVHLHLHDITPDGPKTDSPEHIALERGVDAIAMALVGVR
jgi:hypothetical protein